VVQMTNKLVLRIPKLALKPLESNIIKIKTNSWEK